MIIVRGNGLMHSTVTNGCDGMMSQSMIFK